MLLALGNTHRSWGGSGWGVWGVELWGVGGGAVGGGGVWGARTYGAEQRAFPLPVDLLRSQTAWSDRAPSLFLRRIIRTEINVKETGM